MESVRTFIAVPLKLPEKLIDLTERVKKACENEGWGVKWINLSQLHVTLHFIGDIDQLVIPLISDSLEDSISSFKGWRSGITGFGVFGRGKAPRIIWMGFKNERVFSILKKKIDESLKNILPIEQELSFKPHATIGRIKRPGNLPGLKEILDYYNEDLNVPVEINRVIFYKSELQKKGPIYSPLKTIILKG